MARRSAWFVAGLILATGAQAKRTTKRTTATPPPMVAAPPAPVVAPPPPPAPKPLPSLAVMDLTDRGVGEQVASLVSETVLQEAHKLQGVHVVGSSEIRTLLGLQRQREVLGCADGDACMTELANALGTDEILTGSVGKVGESYVITLQRIDSKKGVAIASDTERLVGTTAEGFLDAVGPMFAKLFPSVPLQPGMTRGASPSQLARASSMRVGTADRRFAFAMAGTAVVLAGGAVVTGLVARNAESQYNALAQTAVTTPVRYADLQTDASRAKTFALTTNILYAAAGAAAITSVVLFAFSGGSAPSKSVNVASFGIVPSASGASLVVSGELR